jgi:undecaprenyl-diphosphatase
MDIVSILILGLVQGITEWIPLSSKTQDTFVYLKFLNGDPSSVVPILLYLHVGTVLAATIYFRKEILAMLKAVSAEPTAFRKHLAGEPGFLFTSLLFTGIVGLPLLLIEKKFLPDLNGGLLFAVMGLGLLATGFLLLRQKARKERQSPQAGWKDGVLTGALQGLSILPGVSRSGTSATGLIWMGFDSESSFHLSFLLSIPTVVLAELVFYIGGSLTAFPMADGLMLAASSFVFGYLTLDAILRVVKRVNLAYAAFALGLIIMAVGIAGLG